MRGLFFILLALNLGLLLWNTQIRPPYVHATNTEQSLKLLSEVITEDPKPTVITESVCFTVGPISTIKTIQDISLVFEKYNIPTYRRRELKQETSGYRILLGPYPTPEAAIAITTHLTKNGIHDHYIINSDTNEKLISLGLFRKAEGAEKRFKEIQKLGLKPKKEIRYSELSEYWLDYKLNQANQDGQIWLQLSERYPDLQRTSYACNNLKTP